MKLKLLRLLSILLVFSSCQQDKKERDIPLKFENRIIVEKSAEQCETEDYSCSIISLEMLQAMGPAEVSEKINTRLEERVIRLVSTEEIPNADSVEEVAENFLQQQQRTAQEFDEDIPWRAYVNQSLYSQSSNLISIGIETEVSTGGAHGYSSLTFLNFNPETGELISTQELFTKGFSDYAEKLFREKEDIPENENINSTGFWFENDRFQLPENIGFERDSILLVYNPYEIASYASGEISLKIPKEDVRSYLKFEEK